MIAAQTSAPRKLDDWLLHFGWQAVDRLQSEFHLPVENGDAILPKNPASSQSAWKEWSLDGPEIPFPNPCEILAANRKLEGPWKFANDHEGKVHLRGDVPRDVLMTDDAFDLTTGQTTSPLECWAEAATAIAKGLEITTPQPKPAAQSLVDCLKERGFVASVDGDKAKVTVPLSGAFREVSVHWHENGFANLSAEIGRLEKWPEPSIIAAEDFLHQANRRLRLVRISQHGDQKVFSMEVCFRAPGPGVWLQAALEALCTGMALVVQPLASLRDQSVADMLLAGKSANKSGGVP
jgi:hypothetical protein